MYNIIGRWEIYRINSIVGSKSDIWWEEKLRTIFTSLDALRISASLPPLAPIVHRIPGGRPLSPFPCIPPSFPLIPLGPSFELYPLNLQLWGAASMRDTFSRKFARRILKPRGIQDQYLVSREEGTRRRRSWTVISILRVLWLADRSFYLPSCARCRVSGVGRENTPRRKGQKGYRRRPLTFRILGRDLVSPFYVIEDGPSRNVISHYVREMDCILDTLYMALKRRNISRFSITRET